MKRRLPRGVSALDRPRGGRAFRAAIRRKGIEVHLGLYETAWLAGYAHHLAAEAIGRRSEPPEEPPGGKRPSPEAIRDLSERVRRRLGLDRAEGDREFRHPPSPEALRTFFEITVVGFWRLQAAETADSADSAALRLDEASRFLFWDGSPLGVLTDLLNLRLNQEFRRSELTREVLDDDGDEPRRVARWLVLPDGVFRETVRRLYLEFFEGDPLGTSWAEVLGLAPPFRVSAIREAYRERSKAAHPDLGGSSAEFVRLKKAYDEAMAHVGGRGNHE